MDASKSNKHTPGPWMVRDARTEDEGETYGALCIESKDAAICNNVSTEADARLTAAAPELLAALELAMHDLRCIEAANKPNSLEGIRATRNLDTIRAVLAKAKGGA